MKKSILLLICLGVHWAQGTINNYEELIHATIQACNEPNRFLSSAYTNDVIAYRSCCTNAFTRCAADISLAVCLMYRMDNDEDCVGDNACYDWHQALVTNILASADIGAASWLRYASAVEFVHGLNFNRRFSEGFVHSTNMLAQIAVNSPEMGITNFWNGMARLQQCEGITLQMAFQINAAIQLAEQKRYSEMFCYTNELPAKVNKKLVEVLQ